MGVLAFVLSATYAILGAFHSVRLARFVVLKVAGGTIVIAGLAILIWAIERK